MSFRNWFFFLLFLSISIISNAQHNELSWSGTERLSGSDFKQKAPEKPEERNAGYGRKIILEGYIFTGIQFSFESFNKKVKYTVNAFMDPEQSWLRDHSDMQTLEHEQAHFDITELYSRKLKKVLAETHNTSAAKRLYDQYFKDLQKEQQKFDSAHKGETGVEPEWKEKIEKGLEEYSKWSDPVVESTLF